MKLFDRLFGEDTTTGEGTILPNKWSKGVPGGWLRRLINLTDQSSEAMVRQGNSSTLQQQLKVIQLFSPKSNFMNLFMCKNVTISVGTKYELKVSFLPQKDKMLLNSDPLFSCFKSSYQDTMFQWLNISFQDQFNHIVQNSKDPTLLLEPFEYFLVSVVRYPIFGGDILTPVSVRSRTSFESKLPSRYGLQHWIQPYPFLRLLLEYFQEFFPFDESTNDNPTFHRLGMLFQQLMIEYWIDSTLIVRQNFNLIQNSSHDRHFYGNRSPFHKPTSPLKAIVHPKPTDVILIHGGQRLFSMAGIQCTYLLLLYLLSDSSLADKYNRLSNTAAVELSGQYAKASVDVTSYLPKYFKTLQHPLFDMFRSVFSRNDINSADDLLFKATIQCWLLYIFPWKAKSIYQYGIRQSLGCKSKNSCKYESKLWRNYVAANLNFYTTLLVLLLKPLSRLDMSIQTFDDHVKLSLLEEILNEFVSDGLWSDIGSLSNGFYNWYPNYVSKFQELTYNTSFNSHTQEMSKSAYESSSSNGLFQQNTDCGIDPQGYMSPSIREYNAMACQHQNLFPDRTIDKLHDCGIVKVNIYGREHGQVIINLISHIIFTLEITQHNCVISSNDNMYSRAIKLMSKWFSWILSFFLSTQSNLFPRNKAKEICDRCRQIILNLSVVLDIDVTNAINPVEVPREHATIDITTIRDRITQNLTSYGKQKYLQGELTMKPYDLAGHFYAGDILDKPLMSNEIKCVAISLVKLSKDLNILYDLPRNKMYELVSWELLLTEFRLKWMQSHIILRDCFRFNFRYLATVWKMLFLVLFLLYLTTICVISK